MRRALHVGSDAVGVHVAVAERRVLSALRVTIGGGAVVVEEDASTGVVVAFVVRDAAPVAPLRSIRCVFALEGFLRGLAIARTKPHWTSPHFVSEPRLLGPSNHLLVWQVDGLDDGTFVAVAALAGASLVGRLGFEDFELGVTLDAGAEGLAPSRAPLFAIGASADPATLVADLVRVGLAKGGVRGRARRDKALPAPLARLGWCSWNAFGKDVSRADVERTVAELRRRRVPLGFVLVDDGWQDLAADRLAGFDADEAKFPGGLAALTAALAPLDVGVWHTLHGYWGGVDASLAARVPLARAAGGALVPDPDRAEGFYGPYYEHLSRAGVRFVKVDSQSATARLFAGERPLLEASQGLHAGVEAAATRAFGAPNVIDCMSMTLDNAASWGASAALRTSDDYLPDTPLNVQEHIHQNAFSSLWGAAFGWPDWDMFQTHDEHAETHAIARAVSGGPVYVTDDASRTRREVIDPLVLADGVVLRADEPGQVVRRMLLRDPSLEPIPLVVGARVTRPGVRAAVFAAFHVDKSSAYVEGELTADDVAALGMKLPAIVVTTGGAERRVVRLDRGGRMPIRLAARQAQAFVASSIEDGVAVVGRVDKYVAPAAVLSCERAAGRARVVVAEPGPVAAWIEGGAAGELRVLHGDDVLYET